MKNNFKQKPVVDIITPVYGGLEFLKGLVPSLLQDYDAGVNFHWWLIDDATPEDKGGKEIGRYLRELESKDDRVTFMQIRENGGYAKSNNLAASKGNAPYILCLNSDTRITHNDWLRIFVDDMQKTPSLSIIGAKLLFFPDSTDPNRPADTTQHAGVAFNLLGHPYHVFMTWPKDHPKVTQRRIMGAVTGACLFTKRFAWRQQGGLDEIYTRGNFEDVQFCVRAMAAGSVILYEPAVTLYHYGSGSNNTETIDRNSQLFLMKNKELLRWDDFRYY